MFLFRTSRLCICTLSADQVAPFEYYDIYEHFFMLVLPHVVIRNLKFIKSSVHVVLKSKFIQVTFLHSALSMLLCGII